MASSRFNFIIDVLIWFGVSTVMLTMFLFVIVVIGSGMYLFLKAVM